MTNAPQLILPTKYLQQQDELQKTIVPYLEISVTRSKANLGVHESKFGGKPYMPAGAGAEYPRDEHGNGLFFMGQLNFAQLPTLPDYPTQGLLQIFTKGDYYDEYVYRYYSELGESQDVDMTSLKVLHDYECFDGVFQINATQQLGGIDFNDFEWYTKFGQSYDEYFAQFGEDRSLIESAYSRYTIFSKIHLGGYDKYLGENDDFREISTAGFNDYQLFLRLSGDDMGYNFGNYYFYIRKQDFREKKFDQMVVQWEYVD